MDLVESEKRGDQAGSRHPWELARFDVVQHLLSDVISDRKDYNVLDIGCGDVFFVGSMARLYPHVNFFAVDSAFTDDLLAKLKRQVEGLNVRLYKSLDEAVKEMNGRADLVLLLDVVEHIGDDLGFLKSLSASPGIGKETRVLITVPAFQGLFCSHDTFLGHYRRYNNKSLRAVTEAAGFSTVRSGYFFSGLLLPRVAQVVKEKLFPRKEATTGLVEWNAGKGVTGLFKGVLYADYRLGRIFRSIGLNLPGLSNYILCRRSA